MKMSRKTDPCEKVLDITSKRVYNIRKDVTVLRGLSEQMNPSRYDTRIQSWRTSRVAAIAAEIYIQNNLTKSLLRETTLPIPTLAGGAIRDLVMGLPPKDYDYFFTFKTADEAYEAIDEFTYYNRNERDIKATDMGAGYGGDSFEDVYGVFNKGKAQFIFSTNDTDDVTDRFDLSSTKCLMDIDTGDITYHVDFLKTLRDRRIIAYNDSKYTENRLKVQTKRMFGLLDRYPFMSRVDDLTGVYRSGLAVKFVDAIHADL